MQNSPLRLGILGAANIAKKEIIPAANETEAVEITAVATRNGEKADEVRDLAPEAGLFEDYASLVESDEIDAVYIPLPQLPARRMDDKGFGGRQARPLAKSRSHWMPPVRKRRSRRLAMQD